MDDSLAIYLHDHLAGSHFAIELLHSITDQFAGQELGQFAQGLCSEIRQDQLVLEGVIRQVGESSFGVKEAIGWLGEKASRLKLRRTDEHATLGIFESLEALTLGIQGKSALWSALERIRDFDSRIPDEDFDGLIARAQDQYTRVEFQRLKLIREAFLPA